MPLSLPDQFILPDYQASTIANIPATAAKMLGVPFEGLPPLEESLWKPLGTDAKRVVIFLVDALGWNIVQQEKDTLAGYAEATVANKITSVFPSITSNCLSSVWTGTAPAQHGLPNVRILFPEFGVIGQTIMFTPAFEKNPDALTRAGLDVTNFLATESTGSKLEAAGVRAYAYKNSNIADSALSKMHGRGLSGNLGVGSVADMLDQVRRQIESSLDDKLYIQMYWETIDKLSHIHTPFGSSVIAEMRTLFWQLKTLLIDALSPAAREGTVVLLIADHGQTPTPPEQSIYVDEHPRLQKMLLMRASGGSRLPFLYAKQGRVQDAIDYINTELSESCLAMRSEEILEAGWLGDPPHAPETIDRLGDIIVLMKNGASWIEPTEREGYKRVIGRHSSLTRDEMEVPFIGWRLG